jgi:hypothetical protein
MKYRIEDTVLTVKDGLFRSRSLALDALRLVSLMIDASSRWYVVTTSTGISSIDLDAVDDEEYKRIYSELAMMLLKSRDSELECCRIILADYDGGSAVVSLKDVRRQNLPIFESLGRHRQARRDRRARWLENDPRVELVSVFGSTAILTKEGFVRGRRQIAWNQVGKIQIEVYGLRTDLLILPRGRSGGIFDLKRRRYSLNFIPKKLKELYSAECFFWLDRRRGDAARSVPRAVNPQRPGERGTCGVPRRNEDSESCRRSTASPAP